MIDLQWVKSSTWQSGPYGMTLEIKGNFIGSQPPRLMMVRAKKILQETYKTEPTKDDEGRKNVLLSKGPLVNLERK